MCCYKRKQNITYLTRTAFFIATSEAASFNYCHFRILFHVIAYANASRIRCNEIKFAHFQFQSTTQRINGRCYYSSVSQMMVCFLGYLRQMKLNKKSMNNSSFHYIELDSRMPNIRGWMEWVYLICLLHLDLINIVVLYPTHRFA